MSSCLVHHIRDQFYQYQLYSECNWETLREVGNLERLEHKLVNHRGAHILNLHCLHEIPIPSGCKIKFKSNNFAESYTIRRVELAIFHTEFNNATRKISKCREKRTECKKQIKNSINNEFPSLSSWIHPQLKRKHLQNYQSQASKKLTKLITTKTATASREPDNDKLKEKNGSTTSPGNHLPVQKGPKFIICPSFIHIINYITATKHIYYSVGENNHFGKTDCTEYYAKVKYILRKFTAKPKAIFSNIHHQRRKEIPTQH